jgi:chemotaxis protein MotB
MALPRHIQFAQSDSGDYWPGFVDALATLLLVIVFLLAVFTAGQFALSQALTGRDEQLAELERPARHPGRRAQHRRQRK